MSSAIEAGVSTMYVQISVYVITGWFSPNKTASSVSEKIPRYWLCGHLSCLGWEFSMSQNISAWPTCSLLLVLILVSFKGYRGSNSLSAISCGYSFCNEGLLRKPWYADTVTIIMHYCMRKRKPWIWLYRQEPSTFDHSSSNWTAGEYCVTGWQFEGHDSNDESTWAITITRAIRWFDALGVPVAVSELAGCSGTL